jgi:hypothetical protein
MEGVKDIKVTVENGVKELVIRHGSAEEIRQYRGYSVQGASIGAVQEYLKRAGIPADQIEHSYAEFSYEELFLRLNFGVRAGVEDKIGGVLKLHPELEKWQINKAKAYDHQTLSRFVKMNRHFFESASVAMQLVSELQQIRVKTEKEYENSDNRRGDAKLLIAQRLVESNIPAEFILKLPIFVGTDPVSVKVEVEVNANDFSCELISPDLKQIIDQETKAIIDAELAAIRELYPELRIFQK